jgi:hypothetical protein
MQINFSFHLVNIFLLTGSSDGFIYLDPTKGFAKNIGIFLQ